MIDMLVDQSSEGLEVLRGSSTYTYDAATGRSGGEQNAVATASPRRTGITQPTSRRSTGESTNATVALDAGGWGKSGGGYWSFPHGHLCLWTWAVIRKDRPLWDQLDQLKHRFGEAKAEFMVRFTQPLPVPERLCDGPVLDIVGISGPSPDRRKEVTIYCIAPKGEATRPAPCASASAEDFFNASGMATPDDLEEFRSCRGLPRPGRAVETT